MLSTLFAAKGIPQLGPDVIICPDGLRSNFTSFHTVFQRATWSSRFDETMAPEQRALRAGKVFFKISAARPELQTAIASPRASAHHPTSTSIDRAFVAQLRWRLCTRMTTPRINGSNGEHSTDRDRTPRLPPRVVDDQVLAEPDTAHLERMLPSREHEPSPTVAFADIENHPVRPKKQCRDTKGSAQSERGCREVKASFKVLFADHLAIQL